MFKPREPRFNSDLTVTVAGQDRNGNPFKQTARIDNISRRGGRVAELRCLGVPGELIEVRHRGSKAMFRVVWIDVVSGQVGICSVADAAIWGEKLPHASAAAISTTGSANLPPSSSSRTQDSTWTTGSDDCARSRPGERRERRFPRYRCVGGVAVNVRGTKSRVWGQLTTIGLGGCYIETLSPFAPGTTLELLVGAYGVQVRLTGEVRCRHPRQGMGIMFADMEERERAELERLIAAAAGRSPGRS